MSKAKEERNLVVGLDIGTSKIVAMVAEASGRSAWPYRRENSW